MSRASTLDDSPTAAGFALMRKKGTLPGARRSVDKLLICDGLEMMKRACQNPHMKRDEVIATLRAHEPELRAAGVVRLSLFGSTVRDDARADSDVDLLAAFDDSRKLSLLDMIGIENRLADLLGQPVDLIEEETLRPRARQSVSREAVRAF